MFERPPATPRTIAIVVPHLTTPSAVMRLAGALAVLDADATLAVGANVLHRSEGVRCHTPQGEGNRKGGVDHFAI